MGTQANVEVVCTLNFLGTHFLPPLQWACIMVMRHANGMGAMQHHMHLNDEPALSAIILLVTTLVVNFSVTAYC